VELAEKAVKLYMAYFFIREIREIVLKWKSIVKGLAATGLNYAGWQQQD